MSRRSILTDPNDDLRQISSAVPEEMFGSPELDQLIEDLFDTMHTAEGIGIAAPQIGVKQRIVIGMLDQAPAIFINPVLSRRSLRKTNSEEGCLSVPGMWGLVKRHRAVTLEWQDREGKQHKRRLKNLEAIVAQHETDHLDGVLFIDKVYKITTKPSTL